MTQEEHKKLGIDLFNATWDLIDRNDRTPAQNLEMIHAAHASAYHWIKAGGTAVKPGAQPVADFPGLCHPGHGKPGAFPRRALAFALHGQWHRRL